MILCVTLNPALDRTLVVSDFAKGGVFRPRENRAAAGGKGINVARAVQTLGGEAVCAGFLGGFTGQSVDAMVQKEGLQSRWTWLDEGETRTCVILVDPNSLLTSVINEPGPRVHRADWSRLRDDILLAAEEASLVSFSGSLPPGAPMGLFESLITELIDAGKQVWLDTSGAPLEAIWHMPQLAIKINDEEASVLTKYPIRKVADAVAAAQYIRSQTGQNVVITMGEKGAVLVNQDEIWHAFPPSLKIKSGVGSGDSFLAGLLTGLSRGEPFRVALAQATAAGTANALSIGGGSFTKREFEKILAQTEVVPL